MRKLDGRRLLGRPRRRWEDYIKMDVKRWSGEAWAGLLWLKTGSCECSNEPSSSIKGGEFLD
jgi:hypothetical protein